MKILSEEDKLCHFLMNDRGVCGNVSFDTGIFASLSKYVVPLLNQVHC